MAQIIKNIEAILTEAEISSSDDIIVKLCIRKEGEDDEDRDSANFIIKYPKLP